MSPKKNYSRYFIILQEEEKGYAQDNDKTPSGYVKLEKKNEKCKVSYYVQNLSSKMQPYYMALICYKKDVKKVINLGKVIIDDYGRVDQTNEYDFDDVARTALSMDKIAGAALVKIVDKNIISLMSGFISSEVPTGWKNFDLVSDKRNETNEEENIFEKYEATIEDKKMTRKDEHSNVEIENEHKDKDEDEHSNAETENEHKDEHDNEYNIKEMINETNEERINNCKIEEKMRKADDRENVEVTNTDTESSPDVNGNDQKVNENDQKVNENDQKVNEREEVINKSDNAIENLNKEKEEIEQNKASEIQINYDDKCRKCDKQNDYDEKYSDMERNEQEYPMGLMGDFFKTIVKGYNAPQYMGNNIKHCNWYKIPIEDIESMYDMSDYDKYTVMYYPMLCYYSYIRKYEHYCLGYKCDNEGRLNYLVYAIQGTKSKMDQPYGGKTGFVTWIPRKDKKDMGYWIMFYDIKNSTVVIPKKKK